MRAIKSRGARADVGEGWLPNRGTSAPLVICGFGQLGQAVTQEIVRTCATGTSVIEQNEARATTARAQGLRAVCGDAKNVQVQRVGQVGSAANIVICIDGPQNERIVQVARMLAPTAYIQMVVSTCAEPARLKAMGADRVLVIAQIAGSLLAGSVKGV